MASTRLPDKPLADIAGRPMIVHVAERARESGLGRVVVATDTEAIAEAVRAHGFEAVMTAAITSRAPTGFSRRCSARPGAAGRDRRQCAGRPADHRAGDDPRGSGAARRSGVDIATLGVEIVRDEERTNPNVVKIVGSPLSGSGCARSISPAPPRPGARGRSTIISASTPIAARRSNASSRCRHRRSKGASGWSSCGRWRPACASMSRS